MKVKNPLTNLLIPELSVNGSAERRDSNSITDSFESCFSNSVYSDNPGVKTQTTPQDREKD